MATSYEDKIKEQAEPFLEQGERVLSAFIAQPRGTTGALAGGSAFGGRKIRQQHSAAADAGLKLANAHVQR
jgi:hypothetical protein